MTTYNFQVQAGNIEVGAESEEEAKEKAKGVYKDDDGNRVEVHMVR